MVLVIAFMAAAQYLGPLGVNCQIVVLGALQIAWPFNWILIYKAPY